MDSRRLTLVTGTSETRQAYRYDVFKATSLGNNHVRRERDVGAAVVVEGDESYTIYLNTFANEAFHLIPASASNPGTDYIIVSRSASDNGRNIVSRVVGEGKIIESNLGTLIQLTWDLFDTPDIFMSTSPKVQTIKATLVHAAREILDA